MLGMTMMYIGKYESALLTWPCVTFLFSLWLCCYFLPSSHMPRSMGIEWRCLPIENVTRNRNWAYGETIIATIIVIFYSWQVSHCCHSYSHGWSCSWLMPICHIWYSVACWRTSVPLSLPLKPSSLLCLVSQPYIHISLCLLTAAADCIL